MKAKKYIGLLNTTLKGVRICNQEGCSEESATLIARGICLSINDKDARADFSDYCLKQYTIVC